MEKEMIHRKLKSMAAIQGITQVEIGRRLGEKLGRPFSRSMINHVFTGYVKSLELRRGICEILGVPDSEIWPQ
jgi:transcriptional regulator with XRE-family HTH domain